MGLGGAGWGDCGGGLVERGKGGEGFAGVVRVAVVVGGDMDTIIVFCC